MVYNLSYKKITKGFKSEEKTFDYFYFNSYTIICKNN